MGPSSPGADFSAGPSSPGPSSPRGRLLRIPSCALCVYSFKNGCVIFVNVYRIFTRNALNMLGTRSPNVFSCDQAAIWLVQSVRPSVRLSVRPSVCLSHLFHHVPIIVSSWNFQELLPWSKVMSMQKVKVRGQRSRSQRSTPNLAVSGL